MLACLWNELSSWQGHGALPAPALVSGLCCPALQCPERVCHRSTHCMLPARGALAPALSTAGTQDPSRTQCAVLAKNGLQPPPCSCSQKPGMCHECHSPVSRTALAQLSGSQAVGSGMSRPSTAARRPFQASRDFSKHLTRSSNAQNRWLEAKQRNTQQTKSPGRCHMLSK